MFEHSDHTFVVCAYGESPYLAACVESVLTQTLPTNVLMATSTPNEHIKGIAAQYGIPLHVSNRESGIGRDWNFAVSCAQTPLVTIAHQDDIYLPRYAERVVTLMARAKRPLIFFCDYGELRGAEVVTDNELLKVKRLLLAPIRKAGCISGSKRVKRAILALGSAVCCPSVTLCTPHLPAPPFSERLKCDLDWDAWERFSRLTGEFVFADEILMHHRIHEDSETSHLIKDNTRTREDQLMFERFWPAPVAQGINAFYTRSQKSNE